MKNNNQDDRKLIRKAARRINTSMILAFTGICLYSFLVFYLLDLPFMHMNTSFESFFLYTVMAIIVVWISVFFLLTSRKKSIKILYWIACLAMLAFGCFLLYLAWTFREQLFLYGVYGLSILLETYGLFRYGRWLTRSFWGRIYFDKVLLVYPGQPETATAPSACQPQKPAAASPLMAGQEDGIEETILVHQSGRKPPEELSYKQIAVRLGVCVYSELILFPIICELAKGLFSSTNGQYNFATTGIFTLCIISAAIWTVAVVFLYSEQPSSKLIVSLCFAAEAAVSIWYATRLVSFASNPNISYKFTVYLLFILLDVVRYGFIFLSVWPVYLVPAPRKQPDPAGSGEYLDESQYEVIEEEPLDEQSFEQVQLSSKDMPQADNSDSISF